MYVCCSNEEKNIILVNYNNYYHTDERIKTNTKLVTNHVRVCGRVRRERRGLSSSPDADALLF
jgi:hypothetical protein